MQTPQSATGLASQTVPPAPAVVEALVQVGTTETRYYRAGRGTPVLVLSRGPAGSAPTPLFAELSRHHCAIAPELPAPPGGGAEGAPSADAVEWLRDVIDGLGLERPGLVVDEGLALDALELALGDPERVGDLVVLRCGSPGEERQPARIEAMLEASNHRILLLHVRAAEGGAPPPEWRAELLRFLAGEPPHVGMVRSCPAR